MFEEYLQDLHKLFIENLNIIEYSINTRYDDDAKAMIIYIKTICPNNFVFNGFEYLIIQNQNIVKKKYRYHFADDKNDFFRWDNAPHHKEINSFPHHFHKKNKILESKEPTLNDVFNYFSKYM